MSKSCRPSLKTIYCFIEPPRAALFFDGQNKREKIFLTDPRMESYHKMVRKGSQRDKGGRELVRVM